MINMGRKASVNSTISAPFRPSRLRPRRRTGLIVSVDIRPLLSCGRSFQHFVEFTDKTIGRMSNIYAETKSLQKISKERCGINFGYARRGYRQQLFPANGFTVGSSLNERGGVYSNCRASGAGDRPAL